MIKKAITISCVLILSMICINVLFSEKVSSADIPNPPMVIWGSTNDTAGRVIPWGTYIRACVIDAISGVEWFNYTIANGGYGAVYTGTVFNINNTNPARPGGTPVYVYIDDEEVDSFTFATGTYNFNYVMTDLPEIYDNSPSIGYTGDSYTFNVTSTDIVDAAGNLTVNASWSHGSLSGNKTLVNSGGDYFEGSVTLDHSVANMTYQIWVSDLSGNTNNSASTDVNVYDNDPPVSILALGSPSYPPASVNHSNITSSTTIYINTTDNIGQFYIHYRTWNTTNGWSSWTNGSADTNLTLNLLEEGLNYIEYYANDTAENNETIDNVTLYVDDTGPTSSLTINEQVHPSSMDGCNVTSSTTMTLTGTDSPVHGAGYSYSYYRFWNESSNWTSWTLYTGAFSLGIDDGLYYLEFNSTDYLGNVESPANNWTIWVDNTAPTTTLYNQTNTTYGYDYYQNTSLTVTGSVNVTGETEGAGLKNVTLYYWFNNATNNASKITSTWEGPFFYNISSISWSYLSNITWDFNFSNGSGYYRFSPMAFDNLTNNETRLELNEVNDSECFFNNTRPNTPNTPTGTASVTTGDTHTYYTNTTDADSDRLKYGWDWNNDGVVDTWDDNSSNYYASGVQISTSHTWSSAGTFYIKVKAVDEHGAVSNWSSTKKVTVTSFGGSPGGGGVPSGYSPNAEANGPYTANVDQTITFTAEGSSDVDGTVEYYRWDWTSDGTYDTEWLTTETTTYSYSSEGVYTVTLQVKDDDLRTDTDTAEVTISSSSSSNIPPVADANGPYEGIQYQDILFNGSNSSDADGFVKYYRWDFDNDGTYDTEWLVKSTTLHNYSESGVYTVKLQVKDIGGQTDTNLTTANILKDSDGDGWSDQMEESYNSNKNDNTSTPPDNDGDMIPDEDSPDGEYTGDTDDDNDGIPDTEDENPKDHDNDGIPDAEDDDDDNDGIPDDEDPSLYDYDNDGIQDNEDSDDDNDGLDDEKEEELGLDKTDSTDVTEVLIDGEPKYLLDTNGDGKPDKYYDKSTDTVGTITQQPNGKFAIDTDSDGKIDYLYDPSSGFITRYSTIDTTDDDGGDIPWQIIILVVIAIIFLIIILLFKTGYLYIEEEEMKEIKPTKSEKDKKKSKK